MSKRIISSLFAVILLVSLFAACGETPDTPETAAMTSPGEYVSVME